MKHFITLLGVLLCVGANPHGVAAFGDGVDNSTRPASEKPLTTYERFLPLAVAGDPAIQHFLGYMFFYGEGVELNYDEAHYWFLSAAEEGDPGAQRNLGIFHARAIDRIPAKFYDAAAANLWFSLAAANPGYSGYTPEASAAYSLFLSPSRGDTRASADGAGPGKRIYQRRCAGCHGFDGRAAYPRAPSFGRGDRLERSDPELIEVILNGKERMPAWRGTLSEAQARAVLGYIRRESGAWRARPARAGEPDHDRPVPRVALGERIYLEFCGGCHGFNGIAWYVNSPSFALRERLHKSDAELAASIRLGRGAMPSWEHMLRPGQIDALVAFIRTLAPSYESGLIGELRRPDAYLRFRPQSETGNNWTGDDQR